MSIWDLLRAMSRRWQVVLLALVVALAGSYVVKREPGVYWSHAEVTFLAPASANNPNALQTTSSNLVVTAGLVAKHINGNLTWNKVSDPNATIVGEGTYDGWRVRLPDMGGQWDRYYTRQVLVVEASGRSEEAVRGRQQELLGRIDATLATMQAGVATRNLITTTVVPASPTVYYMAGHRTSAVAMVWLLAVAGATAVVIELEGRRARAWMVSVAPVRRPARALR